MDTGHRSPNYPSELVHGENISATPRHEVFTFRSHKPPQAFRSVSIHLRHGFVRIPPSCSPLNELSLILKHHMCVSFITLGVRHATQVPRRWIGLLDDEILAILVGCNCNLYSDNPRDRGMGRPILRFRHSITEFLLCKDGVALPCLRTPKEWLCYKRSLNSPLCLIVEEMKDQSSIEHLNDLRKYVQRRLADHGTLASLGLSNVRVAGKHAYQNNSLQS